MSRVALTLHQTSSKGIERPLDEPLNVEGGNFIPFNDGRVHLELHNTDGNEARVKILQPGLSDGIGYPGKEITLQPGEIKLVGPFIPSVYNQTNEQVFIETSSPLVRALAVHVPESEFGFEEPPSFIPISQKGAKNGVAELDSSSKLPESELPSSVVTNSIGEGAPAKGLGLNVYYIQVEGPKHIALWRGKGTGEDPEQIADLTGTPANGSVTAAKVAPANIDGAAATPSMRSLNTGNLFEGEPTDTETPSRNAVATALKLLAKVWRTRRDLATTLNSAAVSGKKYFVLNGQSSLLEPATTVNQPWRVGIVGTDESIAGLKTKYKIKASVTAGETAVKATIKVALFKVTITAGKIQLGEEVAGTAAEVATGETTEGVVSAESGEFELPDGEYAIGAVPSANTTGACGVQARLLAHNV